MATVRDQDGGYQPKAVSRRVTVPSFSNAVYINRFNKL